MGLLSRMGFVKAAPPRVGVSAAPAVPVVPGAPPGVAATIASVAETLRLILNTKAGYGSFVPGLGLGDYFLSAAQNALPLLVAEIDANARAFEPRLVDPVVAVRGRDAWTISLGLTGTVRGYPVQLGVAFDVAFGAVAVAVERYGDR